MFTLRFDLRAPGKTAAERASLYRTAVEMAEWADTRGCLAVSISEHHAADDGFLPSPLTVAAAVSAVTKSVPITIAAALLPFYEPVRLAEDLIALDHLSQGRVLTVLGLGYRPSEYELHGVDFASRGKVADEKLAELIAVLREAEHGTTMPRVTPPPFTAGGPMLAYGGMSKAAARRAGRNGVGFFAQTDLDGLQEAYESAARDAGHEPGLVILPSRDVPSIVFVNDDVDAGWAEVGPSMLADATSYYEWNEAAGSADFTVSISAGQTVDELRAESGAHRVVTEDGARQLVADHGVLQLHPLCGGLDPDVAWAYLERAVEAISAPGPG